MFTADAARIIGITPKQLRAFLRTQAQGVGSGARYEFSHDEVQELSKRYWASQPKRYPARGRRVEDTGTKGLPCEWLFDPSKQPAFLAERRARLERLSARLREAGLDVPQMTERDLRINNRAMTLAKLIGMEFPDESTG